GPGRIEQGCLTLPQRDHALPPHIKGQQLAIAPHATLINGRVREPPLTPDRFESLGRGIDDRLRRVEQATATAASVKDVADRKPRAAALLHTNQLGYHRNLQCSRRSHARRPSRTRSSQPSQTAAPKTSRR